MLTEAKVLEISNLALELDWKQLKAASHTVARHFNRYGLDGYEHGGFGRRVECKGNPLEPIFQLDPNPVKSAYEDAILDLTGQGFDEDRAHYMALPNHHLLACAYCPRRLEFLGDPCGVLGAGFVSLILSKDVERCGDEEVIAGDRIREYWHPIRESKQPFFWRMTLPEYEAMCEE
ncbi:MAG: hypothetical protein JW727_01870 [Candidatus Aenigmarchaeota archaeon]|nr:hypothetical protein [Candidatus Aenigmarchaeota archaeon]